VNKHNVQGGTVFKMTPSGTLTTVHSFYDDVRYRFEPERVLESGSPK
jgi:hypothetical protein